MSVPESGDSIKTQTCDVALVRIGTPNARCVAASNPKEGGGFCHRLAKLGRDQCPIQDPSRIDLLGHGASPQWTSTNWQAIFRKAAASQSIDSNGLVESPADGT